MLKSLTLVLAGLFAFSVNAAEPAAKPEMKWEAGKNYFVIDPPQPVATGDRIEVLEVFSYACIHCAHFQPHADQIAASLPDYAEYVYMPAIFNASWEPFARAFYTAQSLGVLDKTHQALFDALHKQRQPMRSIEDLSTFYAKYGVDPKKFIDASGSFEVESKLARSRDMVPKYGVDGTPSIIVNGKYRITGQSAGGYPQLIELTRWLVEKEHAAKK
jgi:thiol:disulfide interchange protein DsbA